MCEERKKKVYQKGERELTGQDDFRVRRSQEKKTGKGGAGWGGKKNLRGCSSVKQGKGSKTVGAPLWGCTSAATRAGPSKNGC